MNSKIRVMFWLLVVALIATSLLTSFQIANAHSYSIPPGCWVASHIHNCKRCGFLWLREKDREELSWTCPAGNSGAYNLYGSCGSCRF